MITILRAADRSHDRRRKHDGWYTFPTKRTHGSLARGFGNLQLFCEDRLPPSAVAPGWAPHDNEIITYVREGALAFENSLGRSGVLQAGEFQRAIAGHRVHHSEQNPSQTEWAHLFRLWLRPAEAELDPEYEQKRFTIAERRDLWCVVAASDGRRGSLRIHQDALVYSSLLAPGQHMVHPLLQGRTAWLHIVKGAVTVGEFVLVSGDGAGFAAELAVSLTAREPTEILLVDLGKTQGVP